MRIDKKVFTPAKKKACRRRGWWLVRLIGYRALCLLCREGLNRCCVRVAFDVFGGTFPAGITTGLAGIFYVSTLVHFVKDIFTIVMKANLYNQGLHSIPKVKEYAQRHNIKIDDTLFEDYAKTFRELYDKLPKQLIHGNPTGDSVVYEDVFST